MTVLLEELRDSAQRDGVEKFVVGAVIHQDGSALVLTRSELDDFLPGVDERPLAGRAIRLSDEHVACKWVTAENVGGTSCTLETRRVLDAWFAR